MGRRKPLTLLLLLFTMGLVAQTTDLARSEFLHLPFSKSGNSMNRYRALIQAPIKMHKEKKNFFVIGAEYRYLDINIVDAEDVYAFGNNMVNSTQRIDVYIGYTWEHNKSWRFGAKAGPKLQSDFKGKLESDDFIYEVGVYAIRDKRKNNLEEGEKPSRLIVGLTYSNTPGRWYPLPVLNYYKQFHPNWTYTLGVPKTNVRHYLNNNHTNALQVFATLDNDYANIHHNFAPLSANQNPNGKIAETIQTTMGLLGLGYEHFFTENFLFYAYAAHSVYNNFRLEDGDGKKVYEINNENSPYIRAGLKFKY